MTVLLLTARFGGATVHAQSTNVPVAPRFQVSHYEIVGSDALEPSAVDRAMQSAIGTEITVPQIRRALTKLQHAFRDRGYLRAAITLPQQPLTNGVVRLHVVPGPSQNDPEPMPVTLPASLSPGYNFQHFEIYGNSVLPPEEIDRILSPAAGASASLPQLEKALAQLQTAYRERGYYAATVKLPQQVLTDGTVIVKVEEGLTLAAEEALANPVVPPAKPVVPRTFTVQRYEVLGNTLLPAETIDRILAPATGTNVAIQQIEKAKGELQLAYRERGFTSVAVTTPPQQITNATVRLQVTEGHLVDARVIGNRHFSSNNVMRALPTVSEALVWQDQVVNSRALQRELDLANQNRDRQIYPVITPGPEPGTTALELRVKDRLPLHGKLEVNNQSTPGTPDWRLNANINYNNLWQREHSVGISYGFTPEEFKSEGLMNDYFLNRPLVANLGAFYRLPFGTVSSVQQQVDALPGRFGYDEATRQFRLPPAGARPDLTFYANESSSATGVKFGPPRVVSQTPLLTIVSQDSGQNLTINDSAGGRLSVPWALSETRRFSFSGGLDWKRNLLESYNTNNFIITTVVTNAQGSQTIESRVSSSQPPRRNEFAYLPLNFGVDYSQSDKHGSFTASLGLSGNFVGDDEDFVLASYSREAKATYGKATLALTRDQKVFGDWSLLLRASGQVATGPLISNEQFALGGVNSVRGYYEGDVYGDNGWFGSLELRTPFIKSEVPVWSGVAPVWLRGSVFVDGGQRFIWDPFPGHDPYRTLFGAGVGVSANINQKVELRIAVGVPLRDSFFTSANDPRIHFSLGGQF